MCNSTLLNLGVLLLINSDQHCVDILEMANEFLVMNCSITQCSPV